MKLTLEIRMANSEGVLERILGRLRQRNMSVCSISANCSHDQSSIDARITVDSHKAHESALKQLVKLFDVQHLQVHYPDAEPHFVHGHFAGELNEVCFSI